MLVLIAVYLVLGGLFFVPVLYLRRKTNWREKFHWPGGYLIAALLSPMLMPAINSTLGWRFVQERFQLAGTLVMVVWYLSGSFRSGTKASWVLCLAVIFVFPVLAATTAHFVAPLLFSNF